MNHTATLHTAIIAKTIAYEAHAGQTRRDHTTPYIMHVMSVVEGVTLFGPPIDNTWPHVATAWLHDVLEDTDVTPDQLREQGITEDVIDAVVALTHQKGEMYSTYIERVAAHPVARVVKVADIMANMADAPTGYQVQKYTRAMQTIAAIHPRQMVDYAHASAPQGKRFRQYADIPLPDWAVDVRPSPTH